MYSYARQLSPQELLMSSYSRACTTTGRTWMMYLEASCKLHRLHGIPVLVEKEFTSWQLACDILDWLHCVSRLILRTTHGSIYEFVGKYCTAT